MPSRRLQWSAWERVTIVIAVTLLFAYCISIQWAIAIRPKVINISLEFYRGCMSVQHFNRSPNWAHLATRRVPCVLFYSEQFQISEYGAPWELSSSWYEKAGLTIPTYLRFDTGTFKYTSVICPIWLPAWLLGIVLWIQAKRRAVQKGCCIVCGYNLTGNVSGRCPECGTPNSDAEHDAPANKLSDK